MKTATSKTQKLMRVRFGSWRNGLAGVMLSSCLLGVTTVFAMPTVTSLTDSSHGISGYRDGNTFSTALFHTPSGIALDSSEAYLFVADRDNNAIRVLDLANSWTYTLGVSATNLISKPVGVALDKSGNVFILNRGNGTNGMVVEFTTLGDLVATNATKLTNAAAIALDLIGNIYVTVRSNTLIRIAPNGSNSVVTTINIAGTSLQGIVVKHNGLIAACDSGRNGIYIIDPATGIVTTNAGFHGAGDFSLGGNNVMGPSTAKFNQPTGVAEAGDGSLIVTDYGNNRVKVVTTTGLVTNFYGVNSVYWTATFPGWKDGTVKVPDLLTPNVQSRLPVGITFASDGTVYTTEDYYHLIRKVTGTGLPLPPPPPPQVPVPVIGWVSFPPPGNLSAFHALTGASNSASATFNNDTTIAIVKGDNASQVFFTSGQTPLVGSIPDPSQTVGSTPPVYPGDGSSSFSVPDIGVKYPDMTIKAIGTKNDGSPNSAIVQARIQFITGSPLINGNNAAQFSVSDTTFGSVLYYTTDGSDPKSNLNASSIFFNPTTNITVNLATLNFSSNNFVFNAFARRPNYQDSGVVSNYFSATGFIPNRITFGLTNGEPSSTFVARPGQFYYAPVTLQLQPGGEKMYSLQFNVAVTNGLANTHKVVNGAGLDFFSMLMTQVPPAEGLYFPPADGQWYLPIPPVIFVSSNSPAIPSLFTNNNLLGVGWLFRTGFKYKLTGTNGFVLLDFDTASQDLITYSIAHDTLFSKGAGTVIAGAYSFQIPNNAIIGDQYFMQIGSPSGTRDGVGAPGASVYIQPPADSTAVTVGSPSYLVGDVVDFHWFNAGDFGDGMLLNDDVMQVYQAAIEGVDMPPANSDLFAAMDSSGYLGGWDSANNYYTNSGVITPNALQAMMDGNDATINTNAFGDGKLDVSDLYVTLRRSLSPKITGLVWLKRYWTNDQFVAVITPNLATNNLISKAISVQPATVSSKTTSYQQSSVSFTAGDAIGSAGQAIQIPITANVFGSHPLRILGLNLTVYPLDGSPALIQPVVFTPSAALVAALGNPSLPPASKYAANYCAAWLNSGVSGLTGNTTIGTLTITVPTNSTDNSAYAVHFDHASASPNGIVTFPAQKLTGLITLSSRTNSSYGDGIPDSWRLRWFGTINNYLSLSNACSSGDGINNWQKFVAGVDPNVANNFPSVNPRTPVPSGSTTAIHWPTVSGKQYAIERSTSLFPGTWTAITTNTGTGTDMEFDDTYSGNMKFYRVRILP